jgi:hypothetical protein
MSSMARVERELPRMSMLPSPRYLRLLSPALALRMWRTMTRAQSEPWAIAARGSEKARVSPAWFKSVPLPEKDWSGSMNTTVKSLARRDWRRKISPSLSKINDAVLILILPRLALWARRRGTMVCSGVSSRVRIRTFMGSRGSSPGKARPWERSAAML